MTAQRVVVLHSHSLYAELVANLLRAETSVEVVEIAGNIEALVAQVRQMNPHTIIVDSQDGGLESDKLLPSLLDDCPNARGICLAMEEPCNRICPARCRRVNTKSELIGAIVTAHDQSIGNRSPRDAQTVSIANSSLAELLFALAIRSGGADKSIDECAEEEGG